MSTVSRSSSNCLSVRGGGFWGSSILHCAMATNIRQTAVSSNRILTSFPANKRMNLSVKALCQRPKSGRVRRPSGQSLTCSRCVQAQRITFHHSANSSNCAEHCKNAFRQDLFQKYYNVRGHEHLFKKREKLVAEPRAQKKCFGNSEAFHADLWVGRLTVLNDC